MKGRERSERALILAPTGRDAAIAAGMLARSGIAAIICPDLDCLVDELNRGAGFVLVTEEALVGRDLRGLSRVDRRQPEWSDFPFVLLTQRGGGLERNPAPAASSNARQRHLPRTAVPSDHPGQPGAVGAARPPPAI